MSDRPRLKLQGKGFKFFVPLGDGPILPTQGGPNIEERERPGRPSLTINKGAKLKAFDVPAFWDGLANGRRENVKPDVMQVVNLSDDLPLRDFTAEGPMPYSGMRFVMDAPEWRNVVYHPSGSGMLQAELVLHLVEFNDPQAIHGHKRGRGKGFTPGDSDGGVRAPASVVLPRPMTLIEVAAHYAGDPGLAKAIGRANGIHDIKKKLPKGRHLTIPAG